MQASRAIIKTLLYSDIFGFPLTQEELWIYLISDDIISKEDFLKALGERKIFSKKGKYFFLRGHEDIVRTRIEKEKHSQGLIREANKLLAPLAKFPTIKLIGISGSLAVSSASAIDDIDIFIISRKDSVWLTRFFCILYLIIKGKYRWKKDIKPAGKICLNMLISEDYVFPKEKQDIYIAHEISQLLPLFCRENAYAEFVEKNRWLFKFMPNVPSKKSGKVISSSLVDKFTFFLIRISMLERVLHFLQRLYMGKITSEITKNQILAFHPNDYRQKILKTFKNSKI